jgi:uncharacterized protein YcnI
MESVSMRRTIALRAGTAARSGRRIGIVVAASAAAVALFAAPAAAHVTITPTSANQGGFAKVTFNVPNEEDTATTTKVEIDLPANAPVAGVDVKPVPGWTEAVQTSKLASPITNDDGDQVTEAVSKVTFTASAGAGIKPGEFQEFVLNLGPLPKTDQMVFKALQTYSNGDIVRWIDLPVPGGAEPDHPAPVLTLTADPSSDTPAATGSTTTTSSSSGSSGSNGGGALLGLLGLAAGVAALVISILAYRRSGARSA